MAVKGARDARLLGGRYEVGDLLGRGGMGEVRGAIDRRLDRPVAVKLLRHDLAEQRAARERFETEARAAAQLAHPNVVAVFDTGEDDGIPYLVMERLPGQTLADELARGPVSVERATHLAGEILGGLAAAHREGIVHRDIKPANVLIAEDGHAKVADFGIAKTVEAADQTLTGQILATPAYLAPEQVAGSSASPQSDLYSLGVVLYESLSGRPPYAGTTPLAVLRAIEKAPPPPLDDVRPGLPPHLVAAITRAMARDPRKRFESAEEMAAALDPAVSEAVPGQASAETVQIPAGDHDGATRTLAPLPPPGEPVVPRPRLDQRARARLAVVAVACIVMVAVLAGIVNSKDPWFPLVPATTSDDGSTTEQTVVPSTTPITTPPVVEGGGGGGGNGKGKGKGKG